MKLVSALSLSILLSSPAWAENSAWQSSYQLESAGKYNEALSALKPIPDTDKEAELKTLRRGWLLYSLARYDESIREYNFAIERNKQSLDAKIGIILPFLAAKRFSEAEARANAALTLAPNHYLARLRLVVALEGQQKWNEMALQAEKLVANYPSDATAYLYLARAKAWQGKTSEAVAAYSAVLARYPGNTEAQNYLSK